MTLAEKGKVYLVGAGPGDPELLTVKAVRLLATADLVLHDDLVTVAVLQQVGPHALVMSVGKRCGNPKRIRQADIHTLMVDGAQRGLSVVRLKSGDPMIFGRAAEEMDALRGAGVPFEVVPGITAAFAAAAALGCSLTDRRAASSVEFHTGHRGAPESQLDRGTEVAESAGPTRVVYMPGRDYGPLTEAWLAGGESPELPCCVISRAAQPDQSVQWTPLAGLPALASVAAPSILLAGWALAQTMQHSEAIAAAWIGTAETNTIYRPEETRNQHEQHDR